VNGTLEASFEQLSDSGSRLHGVPKGGGTHINLINVNGPISILPVARGRHVE